MKRLFLLTLCCILFSSLAFSQTRSQTELQSIQTQLPALLRAEKFDDVIPIAERIVKLEKQGGGTNLVNYASAVGNLARWKDQRLGRARAGIKTGVSDLVKEYRETAELFGELVALAGKRGEALEEAAAQYELALFRQRFEGPSAEIEALFLQSLAIREKQLPPDDDLVLRTITRLSDLYFAQGQFEKFLPLNRRFVAATEKKFGEKDVRLVPALMLYSDFLTITDRQAEAAVAVGRITEIAGKTYLPEITNAVLGRGESKLDFAFGNTSRAKLTGGLIAIPDPTNINRPSGGVGQLQSGTPGAIVPRESYKLGLAVTEPEPDPRRGGFTRIPVAILIGEGGNVVDIAPETTDGKLAEKIKQRLSKWKFKPFVYDGSAAKMRAKFVVTDYK